MIRHSLFTFFLILGFFDGARAASDCPGEFDLFAKPEKLAKNRSTIVSYARAQALPHFLVKLNHAWVPVLLINRNTLAPWDALFRRTMGIGQSMSTYGGDQADHGFTLLPGTVLTDQTVPLGKTLVFADLYRASRIGEEGVAGTGYRFRTVPTIYAGRSADAREWVSLMYALSKNERESLWFYHAAKRIGLVHIRYAFDQPLELFPEGARGIIPAAAYPENRLGFEHCNNARCGELAAFHLSEMEARIKNWVSFDLHTVWPGAVMRFIAAAKTDLRARNWRDPEAYHFDFLNQKKFLNAGTKFLKKSLSPTGQVDVLSYLLAIHLFRSVIAIHDRLGISETRANQYGNPNISAILLHTENLEIANNFSEGRVRLTGAPREFGNNGFDSEYFEVQNVFSGGGK